MKPLIIIFTVWLSLTFNSKAQHPECDEPMYKTYLSRDVKVAKEEWKKIVADKQAVYDQNPKDRNRLYHLALAQFGLLSATMRDKDEDLFGNYVDQTEENLEKLIDTDKNWGEPRALLSSLHGLIMGYSPWKGMFLGSKSEGLMEEAKKDAAASPLVWKLYANSKFFTPETWGGDIKEAIRAYEKSIQLYEADPQRTKHNWFYLDTMAFLGQAYVRDGQSSKAIEVYEKALKTEPDFGWVKFNLLAKAKKNIQPN